MRAAAEPAMMPPPCDCAAAPQRPLVDLVSNRPGQAGAGGPVAADPTRKDVDAHLDNAQWVIEEITPKVP